MPKTWTRDEILELARSFQPACVLAAAADRDSFRKVATALVEGGRIAIRDVLMERSRIEPVAGALFAVNMLVGTDGGGTYTFEELREDLEDAGFRGAVAAHREPSMNSILIARKR